MAVVWTKVHGRAAWVGFDGAHPIGLVYQANHHYHLYEFVTETRGEHRSRESAMEAAEMINGIYIRV